MIELRDISKFFPSNGVMALENAEFTLRPGEIHALLGENGTGKSTLMHILAGYFAPTSGSVFVNGKERRFSSPESALSAGIGMVRQHPGFVRGFKVWEDCILGAEKTKSKYIDNVFFNPGRSKKRVEEICAGWGFDLPLNKNAESLTVSQRQKAAVLALLLRDVKWFIFDEPTAVLTAGETETLVELLMRLRNEGRGIVLITHKLNEALAVSDRITVIRNGATQPSINTKGLSVEDLNRQIFGLNEDSELNASLLASKIITRRHGGTKEDFSTNIFSAPLRSLCDKTEENSVLVLNNLCLEPPGLPPIRNVNLRLMPGTITGITGVRDGGLETLEHVMVGLLQSGTASRRFNDIKCPGAGSRYSPISGGSITLNGHDITDRGVKAFRDAGGAYLGADRLGKNLATGLPLKESLVIHAFRRGQRGFFLDMAYLNSWCRKIMDKAGIARSASDRTASFSGGMLQRILLAREFAENASLIVLAEPGSGLDKSGRSKIEVELRTLAETGTAILLFSTDMEELTSMAGEILVLRNGELTAFVNRGNNES